MEINNLSKRTWDTESKMEMIWLNKSDEVQNKKSLHRSAYQKKRKKNNMGEVLLSLWGKDNVSSFKTEAACGYWIV